MPKNFRYCRTCSEPFPMTKRPGRPRVNCTKCVPPRPVTLSSGECQRCGTTVTKKARGPLPQHCDDCKAERMREAKRAKYREAMSCIVNYGNCYVCDATIARSKPVTAVSTCGALSCRRKRQADRMVDYAARKRGEGVDIYAPYRAGVRKREKERMTTGEIGSKRERYADSYRDGDARRRAKKLGIEAENVKVREVFERDGWVCGICQLPVDPELSYPNPESASLDHVVPLSRGGRHTRANSRCSHLSCNVRRGARDEL